jgi:hypothetical protein
MVISLLDPSAAAPRALAMRIAACLSARGGRLVCSNCEESLVCGSCDGEAIERFERRPDPVDFPFLTVTEKRTCTLCQGTRKATHHLCCRVVDVFAADAIPHLIQASLADVRRDFAPRREITVFALGYDDRVPFDATPAFSPEPDPPSEFHFPWAVAELVAEPRRFDVKRTLFFDVLVSTSLRLEHMARTISEHTIAVSCNEDGSSWLDARLSETSSWDRIVIERVLRGQRAINL